MLGDAWTIQQKTFASVESRGRLLLGAVIVICVDSGKLLCDDLANSLIPFLNFNLIDRLFRLIIKVAYTDNVCARNWNKVVTWVAETFRILLAEELDGCFVLGINWSLVLFVPTHVL